MNTPRTWTSGYTVTAADMIDMETRLAAPPIGSRVVQKLKSEYEDVVLMLIGDSTSSWSSTADNIKWPTRLLTYLGTRFPAWTVKQYQWNGSFYQSANTIQTGTNGRTLHMYNASWGNTGPRWHQAAPMQMWFEPLDTPGNVGWVDQLFINHGHNGGSGFPTPSGWYNELACLTEFAAHTHSGAEVVVFAQNPRISGSDYQKGFAHETQRLCHLKGYGFVNVWQELVTRSPGGVPVADPTAGAFVQSDGIHPNATGYDIWGQLVADRFAESPSGVKAQTPSSLSTPLISTKFLTNGDLATFTAGSAPTGWTNTNTTYTSDTTNFETNARAVRMQTTATGTASYMSQTLSNLKLLQNRRISVAVRLRIPSSVTSANAGIVGIVETGGSQAGESQSVHADPAQGGTTNFIWVMASKHIGANATAVAVRVYANSTTTEATAQGDISVDRVVVSRDRLPHDLI